MSSPSFAGYSSPSINTSNLSEKSLVVLCGGWSCGSTHTRRARLLSLMFRCTSRKSSAPRTNRSCARPKTACKEGGRRSRLRMQQSSQKSLNVGTRRGGRTESVPQDELGHKLVHASLGHVPEEDVGPDVVADPVDPAKLMQHGSRQPQAEQSVGGGWFSGGHAHARGRGSLLGHHGYGHGTGDAGEAALAVGHRVARGPALVRPVVHPDAQAAGAAGWGRRGRQGFAHARRQAALAARLDAVVKSQGRGDERAERDEGKRGGGRHRRPRRWH